MKPALREPAIIIRTFCTSKAGPTFVEVKLVNSVPAWEVLEVRDGIELALQQPAVCVCVLVHIYSAMYLKASYN
jgi:hypothetical protein